MIYKRKFGKRGLVAALVHESVLNDNELLSRLDAACVQTGITHEYDIELFAATTEQGSEQEANELMQMAREIIEDDCIAVVTVGPAAHKALDMMMRRANKPVMHVGIESRLDMDEQTTFTARHIHPLFKKNMTEENRLYAAGLQPEEVEEEMARRRNALKRSLGPTGLIDTNGCVMVVDAQGNPHHIKRFDSDGTQSDLPIKRPSQPKVFEA